MMTFGSIRFRVIVSAADSLLIGRVAGVTLHGVPSSWQLNVKSLEIPWPSALEDIDFRPLPVDSIWMVARMNLSAPGANLDLLVFSFQVPTKGSAAAISDKVRVQSRVVLAVMVP